MNDSMQTLKITATSMGALLMHSTASMNTMDPRVKEMAVLTKKHNSKKTDEDRIEIQRLEFILGMYHNGTQPVLPGEMILAAIRDGGKAQRLGAEINRSVILVESEVPLIYDGPKSVKGLWAKGTKFVDARTVKVGAARIMRTRPRFDDWGFEATLMFDPDHIDRDQLVGAIETAGARVGLGDYRPRYGRFSVVCS